MSHTRHLGMQFFGFTAVILIANFAVAITAVGQAAPAELVLRAQEMARTF